MWRTPNLLPPDPERATRGHHAAARRAALGLTLPTDPAGEFSPLTSDSMRSQLTRRIPSDAERWHRIRRIADHKSGVHLIRTLDADYVTLIVNGIRHRMQTLEDCERKLFGGASWEDRL